MRIISFIVFVFVSGCSPYIDPNVPEPIRPFTDPILGREYLLYRPSNYNADHDWPLVVACHGAWPDSPNHCMRDWTELAEEKGFLILTPTIKETSSGGSSKAIARLRKDEEHILAAVWHVRGAHGVSDDRVFLYGRAGGAGAAALVGLKNPGLFRAIALAQPKFNSACLTEAGETLDRHQPILVTSDITDAITGKHSRRATAWLQSKGANVSQGRAGSSAETAAQFAIDFFENVLLTQPCIHIRAFPCRGGDGFEIQFKLRSSIRSEKYLWTFGDGGQSPVAAPAHRYTDAGTYRVSVTIEDDSAHEYHRAIELEVPGAWLRSVPPQKNP